MIFFLLELISHHLDEYTIVNDFITVSINPCLCYMIKQSVFISIIKLETKINALIAQFFSLLVIAIIFLNNLKVEPGKIR